MSKSDHISMSVIRRLPRYYRFLSELYEQKIDRISSTKLAQIMNITASQVRQDLNCFGVFGRVSFGHFCLILCTIPDFSLFLYNSRCFYNKDLKFF